MTEKIDQLAEEVAQTYIDALTAEKAIQVRSGGETEIHMVPDHALRLRAAEAIHDRMVGKPRQAVELSASEAPGGLGIGPFDPDLADAAHEFLRRAYKKHVQLARDESARGGSSLRASGVDVDT